MLVDDVKEKCRVMGYSPKTFKTYWGWIESFLRFEFSLRRAWVHPANLGRTEIERYLTHLAVKQNVSPNTQNLALQGILFLYRHVLKIEIVGVNALRAKKPTFIPTVLSVEEVSRLMAQLSGRNRLIAGLGYGCGMRVGEIFALRIKDVDFANRFIHIRQAKGAKDRIVQLPSSLIEPLRQQIKETERLHAIDMAEDCARVPLPFAMERKSPRLAQDVGWWWVFCSQVRSVDPETKRVGRWHRDETTYTRELSRAVQRAGIRKRVTSHTMRHCFATHLMNNRVPLREIQELLGHESIETTQIYMHVEQNSAASNRSPLDLLRA